MKLKHLGDSKPSTASPSPALSTMLEESNVYNVQG